MNYSIRENNAYDLIFKDYPDVLTTKDLQRILGISGKTVFMLLHSGQIKCIKVGRSFRIPKIYLLQYLGLIPEDLQNTSPQNGHSV